MGSNLRHTAITQSARIGIALAVALRLACANAEDQMPSAERAVRAEVLVNASQSEVWKAWSTDEGAQTFFAPKTHNETRIGGPYEVFFNPANERMSTQGMKVLSYIPGEMLSFEWCLPKDEFPLLTGARGWVVAQLTAVAAKRTRVRVTHLGWQQGPEWDRAFAHMNRGWAQLTHRLAARFDKGPMNWQTQQMMWKERAGNRESARRRLPRSD